MIKTLIGGILVGMANIIPGVSGGTMMVILGIFNRLMESINAVFSLDFKTIKKNLLFIIMLLIGVGIGLVLFANVLELAFANYPVQTMFCFIGMVAFSVPILVKQEMKSDKFEPLPFVLGCAVVLVMAFFAPEQGDEVITEFPQLSVLYLLRMLFIGAIAGGVMFIPGVSGSMLLLIIGQYYLFNSLVANVTTFRLDVLVPVGVMGVGIVLGIGLSSKLTSMALKKNHSATMNVILGLVVSSTLVLIPFDATYTLFIALTSALTFIFGGLAVTILARLAR